MALVTTQALSVDTRLKNLSLQIMAGEMLGLIGPNGAGKSTFLNTLAGLEAFTGVISIAEKPWERYTSRQRARLIGLQPQQVNSAWSISVADVVALGRIPWGDDRKDAIDSAMQQTAISHLARRTIDHLSGGERARVWLARVLAGEPQVLLVDEPIANLDIHFQLSVMDVLKAYAHTGHAVVVAVHDLSLAARYCDRLCLLHEGSLVSCGTPQEVLQEDTLESVYAVGVDIDLQRQPPIVQPR